MVAIESTGIWNEIKEQYEKHEKFVGGVFYSLLRNLKEEREG